MRDLIVTASFCGIRVFRTTAYVEFYADDDYVLEIMDAETGEVYKMTPGWDNSIMWPEIAALLKIA